MLEPPPPPPSEAYSDADTSLPSEAPNSSLSSGSLARSSSSSLTTLNSPSFSHTPSFPPPRPHRAADQEWAPIRASAAPLGPRDFKILCRVGSGDVGTVYLCRLARPDAIGSAYAMKVVDRRVLAKKKKLGRAEAEKRILGRLDHPFLPTLFADFDAGPHLSCAVIEFCPGGSLHSLLHRLSYCGFPLLTARFYAAEVLLALEYLHMMGIVYRDLKPENVLIRADGHIMLTDFDLSLEAAASPSLENDGAEARGGSESGTARASCFSEQLFLFKKRRGEVAALPQFVAEPVDARSCSFVGTLEYVAPEMAGGGAHGAAVDWWTYGVFLYELLYGFTPFAGPSREATLRNIVCRPLKFPQALYNGGDATARDLIARLLVKDPRARLGSRRGAADVKAHDFFKGLNFALLRSSPPPVVPPPDALHPSASCDAAEEVDLQFDHF